MNRFHAKYVSASESGGDYFQVLFKEKKDADKAYLLLQRQFEMPNRGHCYIENHQLISCGHFIAKGLLSRKEFKLYVPGEVNGNWSISFDIDEDNYEEIKDILQVILSAPNHLEIKDF